MKKKLLSICMIGLMTLSLSACTDTKPSQNNTTTTPIVETTIKPTIEETTPTTKPTTSIADIVGTTNPIEVSYEKKYKEFIETIENKEDYTYSIAYVYDDDMPELLLKSDTEIRGYELIDNEVKATNTISEYEYELAIAIENHNVVYIPNDYETFVSEISKNIKTSSIHDECSDTEVSKPCD